MQKISALIFGLDTKNERKKSRRFGYLTGNERISFFEEGAPPGRVKTALDICSQIIHNWAKRRKVLPPSLLKVGVSGTNTYSRWRPQKMKQKRQLLQKLDAAEKTDTTEARHHWKDRSHRSWAPQDTQFMGLIACRMRGLTKDANLTQFYGIRWKAQSYRINRL